MEKEHKQKTKFKSLGITIISIVVISIANLFSGDNFTYNIFIEIFCASIGTALVIISTIIRYKELNIFAYIGVGFFFLSLLVLLYAILLQTYTNINVHEIVTVFLYTAYNLHYLIIIMALILEKKNKDLKYATISYLITSIAVVILSEYLVSSKFIFGISVEYIELCILTVMACVTFISLKRSSMTKSEKFFLYGYLAFIVLNNILSYLSYKRFNLYFYSGTAKFIAYSIMFEAINRFVLNKAINGVKEDLEKAQKKQIELNHRLNKRNRLLVEWKNHIEKSERKYIDLIDAIKDGIMIFYYGKLSYINSAAIGIFNYDDESNIIGKSPGYVLKDIVPQLIHSNNYELYSFGDENNNGQDIKIGQGEYKLYVFKLDEFNRLIYIQDISYIKKTIEFGKTYENYLKEEEVKNEFYSNISHELRTPINLIYSAIQLNDVNLVDNQLEQVTCRNRVIKQNCLRLIRTINNFIDVNRISGGYLKPNMKVYNIVSVIETISLECTRYIEKINGQLTFDAVEEEIFVECDKDMIERVMLNLLSNSVKYGKEGGKVFIYIEEKDDMVLINVSNNGYTIEKSLQPYIFDKFTKINKSLNRKKEGSGLGLYLVKELLELQGGAIELEANTKAGSKFIITLPKSYEEEKAEIMDYEMNPIKEKVDMEFSDIYL